MPRVPTAPPALGHHWQVGGLRSQLSKQDPKVLDVKSTLGWRGGQVGILAFGKDLTLFLRIADQRECPWVGPWKGGCVLLPTPIK